jgi:hypothetical protein
LGQARDRLGGKLAGQTECGFDGIYFGQNGKNLFSPLGAEGQRLSKN